MAISRRGRSLTDVLHGGQSVNLLRPIPCSGYVRLSTSVTDVWDKGRNAVVVTESTAHDDVGPLLVSQSRYVLVGHGGFDGPRGPSVSTRMIEHSADYVGAVRVMPNQALLYRLLGDRNPLHSDPSAARAEGFDGPVLHGLCTYGMTLRAILDLTGIDPERIRHYDATFANVVYPGDWLKVEIWQDGDSYFGHTSVSAGGTARDGLIVLRNVQVTVSDTPDKKRS